MDNYNKELSIEKEYLNKTILQIIKQLEKEINRGKNEKIDIISSRKELWEDVAPSSYDIDSLLEASQYKQFLNVQVSNYMMTENKIKRLDNMLKNPYFARVDFIESGEFKEEIYIGLSTLIDDDNHEIYIYDWRSPIASIFYRFDLGKVHYESPMGTIYGDVLLKRQYEIKNRKLEYFFDSNIQISDTFLGKILSENTSPKMKTIVETIQRDQDLIIRDIHNDLLIVQGVAGSGKTSVALHRVAYLMYQGLGSKLLSHNIIIISPNSFFSKYIENVLPELGEEKIETTVFEDFYEDLLHEGHGNIQTRNQFLEDLITSRYLSNHELKKSSMKFKSSKVFIEILKRFIYYYERRIMKLPDIYYDNQYVFDRHELKDLLFKNYSSRALGIRLKDLERIILEAIREIRRKRILKLESFINNYSHHVFDIEVMARFISIKESGQLYEKIKDLSNVDCLSLYKILFQNRELFFKLSKGLELPKNINDILDYARDNLESNALMHEDALALLFLNIYIYGYSRDPDIKQVIIDESQDYYPIHFEILKSLFPRSKYTLLGDFNQTIEKQEDMSFYHDVQNILKKERSTIVSMNKSFRCTKEIISFSSQFLEGEDLLESFNRSGDMPKVVEIKKLGNLAELISKEVLKSKDNGFNTIGILCKSKKEAISLFEELNKKIELKLLDEHSNDGIEGVFIIPIYMAKGLEFDSVIIIGVDDENYNTTDDKKLLYIGCTRALHRLAVFYTGTKSRFLKLE